MFLNRALVGNNQSPLTLALDTKGRFPVGISQAARNAFIDHHENVSAPLSLGKFLGASCTLAIFTLHEPTAKSGEMVKSDRTETCLGSMSPSCPTGSRPRRSPEL